MPLEYFDEDVNEETVASGGAVDLILPGFYQMRITNVTENEKGNYEVDMVVVCGTRETEIGKRHKEFFSMNPKKMNRKRRIALALAANCITRAQMAAERAKPAEEQRGFQIDYFAAVNHHIVVEIDLQQRQKQDEASGEWVDTGKQDSRISYDNIWHIDDKEVARKRIPVNKSKIDLDPFGSPPERQSESTDDGDF